MEKPQNRSAKKESLASRSPDGAGRWPFRALLVYVSVVPFIDALYRVEVLGSLVGVLWGATFLLGTILLAFSRSRPLLDMVESKVIVCWLVYLGLHALFYSISGPAVGALDAIARNLRFLVQAVPLFFFVLACHPSKKQINQLLVVFVLLTPLSIIYEYLDREVMSVMEAAETSSAVGISYNVFVPHTTFALFAGVYLVLALQGLVARLLVGVATLVILVFIFANPSRQSVLFVLSGSLCVSALLRGWKTFSVILVSALLLVVAVDKLGLEEHVGQRFFSKELLETSRTIRMAEGLATLKEPWDWLFGCGLWIQLEDGVNPHNNYIFTAMRTGLVGVFLMFFPLCRGFFVCARWFGRYHGRAWFDPNEAAFIMISLWFPIFHSLFGYPHLVPLSAPLVWLALAFWVVFQRETIARLREPAAAVSSPGTPRSRRLPSGRQPVVGLRAMETRYSK